MKQPHSDELTRHAYGQSSQHGVGGAHEGTSSHVRSPTVGTSPVSRTCGRLRFGFSRGKVAGYPGAHPYWFRPTHHAGVPWARIGEHVGQRNLAVTANTYTHAMIDEAELDYEAILR